MLFALMFGLPLVCGVAWIVLLARGRWRDLATSVVMCGVTIAIGYWSIFQSRASTAGIGVLFLPGAGALSGLLAALFARLRTSPQAAIRTAAWLCLLASAGMAAGLGASGIEERSKNARRDRQQAENVRAIDENRAAIAQLIQQNPGNERAALDAAIDRHKDDRTFLIPALGTPFVSEDRLDQLSADNDSGVVLAVARNPRTRPDTLEKIYRHSAYPPSFFQALAEHKNTPVDILRTLAAHPEPLGSLDRSLARNPSAPREILDRIAGSDDVYALRSLLGNAALDCGLLRKAVARLGAVDRNEIQSSDATIGALEARLCAAK